MREEASLTIINSFYTPYILLMRWNPACWAAKFLSNMICLLEHASAVTSYCLPHCRKHPELCKVRVYFVRFLYFVRSGSVQAMQSDPGIRRRHTLACEYRRPASCSAFGLYCILAREVFSGKGEETCIPRGTHHREVGKTSSSGPIRD